MRGCGRQSKEMEYFQTRSLRIESDHEIPVEADGELIPCPMPIHITKAEKRLTVLVSSWHLSSSGFNSSGENAVRSTLRRLALLADRVAGFDFFDLLGRKRNRAALPALRDSDLANLVGGIDR